MKVTLETLINATKVKIIDLISQKYFRIRKSWMINLKTNKVV